MRSSLSIIISVLLLLTTALNAHNEGLGLNTVVIDAGHGGKDPGCISADGKTYEKTITLKLSALLEEKILNAYPEMTVIRTRTSDKFIPLDERADIANRNHANLFISLHIDANKSSTPKGFSTLILGQSRKGKDLFSNNMDLCKRENSVILLEDDYSTKYQGYNPEDPESFIFFNLMQNAFYEQSLLFAAQVNTQMAKGPLKADRGIFQEPILVLWKTTMPAVLIESGFISNKEDLAVLRNDDCLDKIAQAIFRAFREFKAEYDGSLNVRADTTIATAAEPSPSSSFSDIRYGIQILASSKKMESDDAFFKGYRITSYKIGNLYKYIAEESSNIDDVVEKSKKISSQFGEVFIVKIENETVSIFRK